MSLRSFGIVSSLWSWINAMWPLYEASWRSEIRRFSPPLRTHWQSRPTTGYFSVSLKRNFMKYWKTLPTFDLTFWFSWPVSRIHSSWKPKCSYPSVRPCQGTVHQVPMQLRARSLRKVHPWPASCVLNIELRVFLLHRLLPCQLGDGSWWFMALLIKTAANLCFDLSESPLIVE